MSPSRIRPRLLSNISHPGLEPGLGRFEGTIEIFGRLTGCAPIGSPVAGLKNRPGVATRGTPGRRQPEMHRRHIVAWCGWLPGGCLAPRLAAVLRFGSVPETERRAIPCPNRSPPDVISRNSFGRILRERSDAIQKHCYSAATGLRESSKGLVKAHAVSPGRDSFSATGSMRT